VKNCKCGLVLLAGLQNSDFSKRWKEVKHEMLEVMAYSNLFQAAGATWQNALSVNAGLTRSYCRRLQALDRRWRAGVWRGSLWNRIISSCGTWQSPRHCSRRCAFICKLVCVYDMYLLQTHSTAVFKRMVRSDEMFYVAYTPERTPRSYWLWCVQKTTKNTHIFNLYRPRFYVTVMFQRRPIVIYRLFTEYCIQVLIAIGVL